MRVIERSIVPKSGKSDLCEDGVVVTEWFAAVVDGATDKSGRRFDGHAGGRFALQVLTEAIRKLAPDTDPITGIRALTSTLAERLPHDLGVEDRPSAAVSIFSARRREVWQVGDVGFWHEGLPVSQPHKASDRVAGAMRAAVLKAALLGGADPAELAEQDIGREAILPLLTRQAWFANDLRAGDLAYASVNGVEVPSELVVVAQVPASVVEVVLASDGYPSLAPTLSEAEATVKRLMAEDPLCIGPLAGTKGIRPGALGYDDRAYLRLEI